MTLKFNLVVHEPGLRATLRRLRGRKLVFSNAPVHYSLALLDALGSVDFSIRSLLQLPRLAWRLI